LFTFDSPDSSVTIKWPFTTQAAFDTLLSMTKNDLIEKVAKKSNLTKRAASDSVNATFNLIRDSLIRGEKVVITGFGTFVVRSRAARRGRNPQTGQAIQIPQKKTPGFIAGKTIKRHIK
jgi:nucleoid DNA-binding protein